MSHLMDYGPDWPPRSPRLRSLVFGRAFWVHAALLVATFVTVAAIAKISDRPERIDFTPTVASTPRSHHPGNP